MSAPGTMPPEWESDYCRQLRAMLPRAKRLYECTTSPRRKEALAAYVLALNDAVEATRKASEAWWLYLGVKP